MESVEARFDSVGQTNATYKVYLSGTSYHPLWVYSDGQLYVNWDLGLQTAGANTAAACQTIWGSLVKSSNKGGSFVAGGLAAVGPTEIARKLQKLADAALTSADNGIAPEQTSNQCLLGVQLRSETSKRVLE